MTTRAVVNASPLIYLARADLFNLLRLAGNEVVVTASVLTEIEARGAQDPAVAAVRSASWIRSVEAPSIPSTVVAWDLGLGESSVIAWALANPPSRAVIDDLQGRRCATSVGVPLRGTLGLVLRAKRSGHLESARNALDRLMEAGMYLSRGILDAILAEVDE
jgi:predicted nucleic acid-binding protein